MFNLFIIKNSSIHKEDAILTLVILKGSLKINSSIIGDNNEIFKTLNKVNLMSFWGGNKSKYFKGVVTPKPITNENKKRIRNDFHTNFKKEEKDLISNWFPKPGFFKNEIKSLISIMRNLNIGIN